MRFLLLASALFLFTGAVCAENSHLSGVWRADLHKSKFGGGPPPTNYLVIIEQKRDIVNRRTKEEAPLLVETTAMTTERGERRSVFSAFDYPKPVVRPYEGIPTRLTGKSSGSTFTVLGEIAGSSDHFTRVYTLSPDSKTLTLQVDGVNEGHPVASTVILNKAPEADGAPLRKPEELASTRFKNVKVSALKNLPASEFINQMHYFAWSLGKECTFCHVEHKFDSDEKKEKQTARKMVDMAVAINEHNFEGHPEVRCFTCHEGHQHPLSRPLFADETVAAQKERDQADHAHHEPPPAHK